MEKRNKSRAYSELDKRTDDLGNREEFINVVHNHDAVDVDRDLSEVVFERDYREALQFISFMSAIMTRNICFKGPLGAALLSHF